MWTTIYRTSLALCLALTLTRCADDAVGPDPERPPINLTPQQQHVVAADNAFGLRLFQRLGRNDADANLFISPLSVSMALGMTLNGARGDTRAAMEKTLELAGLAPDEINASYRALIDLLTTLDPKVRFSIANAVWYREGFAVEPAFIEANRSFFDAAVQALDFSDPNAARTINRWVEDHTEGRIDRIVDPPIDPLTMMFLINAVYFKGEWRYRFKTEDTRDDTFTRGDGSAAPVRMMTLHKAALPYLAGNGFQAVDLPYGDSLFSMTVLLPHEGVRLDTFVAGLDHERWTDWTGRFAPVNFDRFQMPRFSLEYDETLNDVLKAMGMDAAFDPARADFGGINPDQKDLHISKVKHKTFVEVDEKGTEAAAVTAVEVGVTSADPVPRTLRIDRPFVFAIREQATGAILFIGRITDPG